MPPIPNFGKGAQAEAFAAAFVETCRGFLGSTEPSLTAGSLLEGTYRAMRALDQALDKLPTEVRLPVFGKRKIACKKGCYHCCHLQVAARPAPVLTFAEHLRRTLKPTDFEALLARLKAHHGQSLQMDPIERALGARLCPLNIDGGCIGYTHRTFKCREYHSFDVDRCIQESQTPAAQKTSLIPSDVTRMQTLVVVEAAFDACCRKFGLDTQEVDMVPALILALEQPDILARYVKGEPVFAECRSANVEVVAKHNQRLANQNLLEK